MRQQAFASPGEALEHFGTKGMRWGVRNDEDSVSPALPKSKEARRARAKKVALGIGVLTAVAGAGYVAYKLNQSGNLPLSSFKKKPQVTSAITKILSEPTDILHASRGKTKGFRFFKDGNTPTPIDELEKAFGVDRFTDGLFRKEAGRVITSFVDPEGRLDQSGRIIPHQIIIPRSMSGNINSMDDVMTKIWPLLKDTYSYD